MSRRAWGNRPVVDQLVRELGPRRPGPFLLLWRWRWELGLVAAAVTLGQVVRPELLLPVAGVVVALCSAVPPLRHLVRDRFWCVATQHRLRAGFRESDVRSWSGRMPAVVWTSARPYGERVLLACPAGVDAVRIATVDGELAAACWAVDVVVRPHPTHTNLVTVDVVRRAVDTGAP